MKIFASALEGVSVSNEGKKLYLSQYLVDHNVTLQWNLLSYFYLRNHMDNAVFIRDNSTEILIDSGAHSFQFGQKADWISYTKQYAEFITKYDKLNVVGYFEMDIENVIGYEKVLELREILESASNKIIPVWHPLRGINDYEKMCQKYANKIIAIGGFRNTDIRDHQFLSFLKVAKKYNCRVHCLGMSRQEVLLKVPFDYCDSATWLTATNMGNMFINGIRQNIKYKFPKAKQKEKFDQYLWNYSEFVKYQNRFYYYWKKECKD